MDRSGSVGGLVTARAKAAAPKAVKTPRPKKPAPDPLNWRQALIDADKVLAEPPAFPHIVRVTGVGELVRRFAVPIELCPTTNETRHQKGWQLAKTKKNLFAVMLSQTRMIRSVPLPGRPMLRCIRFSSKEPDKYSDWMKMAVDRLLVGESIDDQRLGYLSDDSPSRVDIHAWWEAVPKGKGFCVIELWTGAAT